MLDADRGGWEGPEPFFFNILGSHLALAVGALANLLQGRVYIFEYALKVGLRREIFLISGDFLGTVIFAVPVLFDLFPLIDFPFQPFLFKRTLRGGETLVQATSGDSHL